eukprot:2544093-Rhodomonas_salina.1
MIDFLHDKVEEFADVDAAIYFGLLPHIHRSAFSNLELEQREHNALQEEVAKWNVYEQQAKHDAKLEK